jgi:predicted alpha/beta-fold hydrolase
MAGITISPLDLSYTHRPYYLFNKHVETVIPSVFFTVAEIVAERKRLELSDGDFVDLDWYYTNTSERLVILSHGMGGSTDRYYMKRSAEYFFEKGWNVLAWNNRGCSGEINRLVTLNHHGDHKDLELVVAHALGLSFKQITLIGFSMGGSHVANFLSQSALAKDPRIIGGTGFSVTCDMKSMMKALKKPSNWIYRTTFLKKLKKRILELHKIHSKQVDINGLESIKSFDQFHEKYTTPIGGYRDIEEFYYQATPNNFLPNLQKPMLIVNALNDPLLGKECYPYELGSKIDLLKLETPKYGGHLGFNYVRKDYSYMEVASEAFFEETLI